MEGLPPCIRRMGQAEELLIHIYGDGEGRVRNRSSDGMNSGVLLLGLICIPVSVQEEKDGTYLHFQGAWDLGHKCHQNQTKRTHQKSVLSEYILFFTVHLE